MPMGPGAKHKDAACPGECWLLAVGPHESVPGALPAQRQRGTAEDSPTEVSYELNAIPIETETSPAFS